MTAGEVWLRYHCLRRWLVKVVTDGPDLSLARYMPREAIFAAHEERLTRLEEQLRAIREEAERLAVLQEGAR